MIDALAACGQSNVQACLTNEEGDARLDALADARTIPETFTPSCSLVFRVLARGASFQDVFGWYNVVPHPTKSDETLKPADYELYPFLLCDDPVGTTKTLDIRSDPNYKGGKVGFFMATPGFDGVNCPTPLGSGIGGFEPETVDHVYYSEAEFNPDSRSAEQSFIHLLTWQSITHEDSFYFGWEDLFASGDSDFDDLLTRVSGITCAADGTPCETEGLGVCRNGSLQCRNGEPQCVPIIPQSSEICNALDDDCDGDVDEGDELCEGGKICHLGKCVLKCGSGEFPCASDKVCDRGVCVDPECAGIDCPTGQICRAGECEDGCLDAKCPPGQICRNGACIDLCEAIECDPGFTCHLGVCTACNCTGCEEGFECVDNVCIEDACATVACDEGFYCRSGECVGLCEGVICPGDVPCENGGCAPVVYDPNQDDPKVTDAGVGDASVSLPTIDPSPDESGVDDLPETNAPDAGATTRRSLSSSSEGCACRVPGASARGTANERLMSYGVALLLGSVLFRRRWMRAE